MIIIMMITVNFFVSVDHKEKIKESETIDIFLDLAREPKNLCNMKVTVVPIVVGAHGTVLKGLWKRLGVIGDQEKNREHPDHS